MAEQRKLPIGIQDFEKLRKYGCIYVDKTEQIYRLVSTGCYYFLSRPRRFGKSLLISTLKALFEGKRELFEGLAITGTDFDWTVRPVLHLDLNTQAYDSTISVTSHTPCPSFLTNSRWSASESIFLRKSET